MARPLRLEFAGALYHVTTRGNARADIFLDDEDRQRFLAVLGATVTRLGWFCHGYCLMDNHYHLLIETPEPNLSQGMRQINGVYTQSFNRRHGRVGHVMQGRFKAILVERDSYLLELTRYIAHLGSHTWGHTHLHTWGQILTSRFFQLSCAKHTWGQILTSRFFQLSCASHPHHYPAIGTAHGPPSSP